MDERMLEIRAAVQLERAAIEGRLRREALIDAAAVALVAALPPMTAEDAQRIAMILAPHLRAAVGDAARGTAA